MSQHNPFPNDLCEVCEKPFDRIDLEYVALHLSAKGYSSPLDPKAFFACRECACKEKLNFYHTRWLEVSAKDEERRTEDNIFRTLMMKPNVIQELSADSEMSVRSYMLQHQTGWEALPLDSLIFFLDLLTKHANFFGSILARKATKEEISQRLIERTNEAKVKHSKKLEVERIDKNAGLKGHYSKDQTKAILSMMKTMKCSEDKAFALLTSYDTGTGLAKGIVK